MKIINAVNKKNEAIISLTGQRQASIANYMDFVLVIRLALPKVPRMIPPSSPYQALPTQAIAVIAIFPADRAPSTAGTGTGAATEISHAPSARFAQPRVR